MDIFSKNKLLLRIIVLLLILNLFSTAYLFYSHSKNNEPKPKRNIEEITALLKGKLDLSEQQLSQLSNLRQDFFNKEEKLSTLIRSERDSMNELMFNQQTDTALVMQIARRVADNEYQMELYRLEQAQQLKTICTAEQLKKFEALVKEIRDYFQPVKK